MLALKGEKKVLILSGVLLALVLLYVLGLVFSPASRRRREMETPLFPILSKELITRIEISEDQERLELRKTGNDWTVLISGVYFPASEARVDAFLNHVISLKQSKRVSDDPATWDDFRVGEGAADRLVLTGSEDKTLVDLVIGKEGLGGKGTYVRKQGGPEVVQVDSSLSYYLNAEPRFWSDLGVFPGDLEGRDVRRLSIKLRVGFAPGTEPFAYTLVRDENEDWIVEGREDIPLDNQRVDGLAGALVGFEGTEFVAGVTREKAGFGFPAAEIFFSTADQRVFRLLVGNAGPEADQYYVCLDGQTYCFLAAAWRLESVLRPLSELVRAQAGS